METSDRVSTIGWCAAVCAANLILIAACTPTTPTKDTTPVRPGLLAPLLAPNPPQSDAALLYPADQAACLDGVAASCLRMVEAVKYMADHATTYVPPGDVKAAQAPYYVMACHLGDDRGCVAALQTLPASDEVLKTHVLEKRCALGVDAPGACARAAARYMRRTTFGADNKLEYMARPDDHPLDRDRASRLAAEACARGDADGCWLADNATAPTASTR